MQRKHPNMRTYTRADITKWQRDVCDLPEAIQACEGLIREIRDLVTSLQHDALPFVEPLEIVNIDIDALTAQIHTLTLPDIIAELEDEKAREVKVKDKLQTEYNDLMDTIKPLEQEVLTLEVSIKTMQLREASNQLANQITKAKGTLNANQIKLGDLESQLHRIKCDMSTVEPGLGNARWQESFGNNSYLNASFEVQRLESKRYDLQRKKNDIEERIAGSRQSIHNQQNLIEKLQNEKRQKDAHITELVATVDCVEESSIEQLQQRLSWSQQDLAPLHFKRHGLEEALNLRANDISQLNRQISANTLTFNHARENNSRYKGNLNIDNLKGMREQQQAEKKRLLSGKGLIDNKIIEQQSRLAEHKAKLDTLWEQQTSHNNNRYLEKLSKQQIQLYTELKEAVVTEFARYEDKFPAAQQHGARSALLSCKRKLTYIDGCTEDERYWILCGLLWHLYRANEQDTDFANCLATIMGSDFLDERESSQCFTTRKLYVALHDLTPIEIFNEEKQRYETAARNLDQLCQIKLLNVPKEIQALQNSTKLLLKRVNANCVKALNCNDVVFDLKLYITLLNNTCKLLNNPANQTALAKHAQLSKCMTQYEHSFYKKITGTNITDTMRMVSNAARAAENAGFGADSLETGPSLTIAGMYNVTLFGMSTNVEGAKPQPRNIRDNAWSCSVQ